VNIYNDFSITKYFWSISTDLTGKFIICGCHGKKILCSSDEGLNFQMLTLSDLGGPGILTCANPNASQYVNNQKSIFICYSRTTQSPVLYYIYYDTNENLFTSFNQNYGNYINCIVMTDLYIIIAPTYLNGFFSYENPIGYKTILIRNNPIRSINGLNILSPFTIMTCNENYIAIQGIDKLTFKYSLWKTSIFNNDDDIIKINLDTCLNIINISNNNVLYAISSNNQNLYSYYFTKLTYERILINTFKPSSSILSICLNNFDSNLENNKMFIGTNFNDLYYSDDSGLIYKKSIIQEK
jgi:hypothetical protein